MFRMYRTWLTNDFCQPVYEEWFAEAVAKGRIPRPAFFSDPLIRKAYTGAEWNGPGAGPFEPGTGSHRGGKARAEWFLHPRPRSYGNERFRLLPKRRAVEARRKMLREVKENGENGNAAGKTEE